jgi:archaellin
MKKVFMAMAIVAAMFAAASCNCCNNSKKTEKAATECRHTEGICFVQEKMLVKVEEEPHCIHWVFRPFLF